MEKVELVCWGMLWMWMVQGFLFKLLFYVGDVDLVMFVLFGIGYIELLGQVKVEVCLIENDLVKLKIGMEMELMFVLLIMDVDGNIVMTFVFWFVVG